MNPIDDDPLLQLYGSGKELWADEHADEYVRRIREGWDGRTAWDRVEEEAKARDTARGTDRPQAEVSQDDESK